jgi:DNA polymerase kappa
MKLTPYLKKTGMTAEQAIQQMREEVKHETGLTVSAGCGANTMLGKIAADFNKPDGQYVVSLSPRIQCFDVTKADMT